MDHAKLLDVLTALPESQSILPRAECFAKSRPANHAICSFIDSSGYASGPIRRCLFIDYIIIWNVVQKLAKIRNQYNQVPHLTRDTIWAVTCDFQQCGILTSVDSDEPVQPPLRLRNSK